MGKESKIVCEVRCKIDFVEKGARLIIKGKVKIDRRFYGFREVTWLVFVGGARLIIWEKVHYRFYRKCEINLWDKVWN